jgi:4-carboxymuconolactone decarboxylase
MDERERHAAGMEKRRRTLGNEWVDRSIQNKTAFNAEFLDLITRYAWGEIWTRPGLDERTRRLLVLATTSALGRWEEFRIHLRAALAEGKVPLDDIKELLLQQAIYAGVPVANTAFNEARAVIEEMGKKKGA